MNQFVCAEVSGKVQCVTCFLEAAQNVGLKEITQSCNVQSARHSAGTACAFCGNPIGAPDNILALMQLRR